MTKKSNVVSLTFLCILSAGSLYPAASSSSSQAWDHFSQIEAYIEQYKQKNPDSSIDDAIKAFEKDLAEDEQSASSSHAATTSIKQIPFNHEEILDYLNDWTALYLEHHPKATPNEAYEAFYLEPHTSTFLRQFEDVPRYICEYQTYLVCAGLAPSCSITPSPQMDKDVKDAILFGYPPELVELFDQYKRYPLSSDRLQKFIILWGEPGVGKSSAGTILASETKRPLIYVKCASIETEWKSSETVNLRRILDPITTDCKDPWVILLDEIDSMDKKDSERRTAAFTVLQEIMHANENPNITIIATSNYVEKIADSTVRRGCASTIELSLPGFEARRKIAQIYLEKNKIKYSREILDYIAWSTGGWLLCTGGLAGREIEAIINLIVSFIEKKIWDALPKDQQNPLAFDQILKKQILLADFHSVASGLQFVKQNLYNAGRPVTDEGRLWKKIRDSKEFSFSNLLAAINTFNGCVSTFTGVKGSKLQQEALALQKEQLDFSKETFEWQKRQADIQNSLTGLSILAGFMAACTIQ